MKVPNNIVKVPSSIDTNFFKYWLSFLKPFHKLTSREIEIAAEFMKQRYELGKVIKDMNVLDEVVMSKEIKSKIREQCNLSVQNFHVVLNKLKKANIIVNNKINKRFIPNIKEGEKDFQLLLVFEL